MKQTYENLEIVVVNDGSSDDSLAIIQELALQDSRIVLLNKNNEGTLLARKSGIEKSKGKYIFNLDGDDYIEPYTIEVLYKVIIKQNCQISICETIIDKNAEHTILNLYDKSLYSGNEYIDFMFDNTWFSIWGKLIEKDLFTNLIYPSVHIVAEDALQMLQLMQKVNCVGICPIPCYYYVYRENSATNNTHLQIATRDLKELFFLDEFLGALPFYSNHRVKFSYFILNKLCYSLRVLGRYSIYKKESRALICRKFWKSKENRDYLFKKNKRIFFMIVIEYFSPLLAKLISIQNLRRVC